jgi:hypothetical protein
MGACVTCKSCLCMGACHCHQLHCYTSGPGVLELACVCVCSHGACTPPPLCMQLVLDPGVVVPAARAALSPSSALPQDLRPHVATWVPEVAPRPAPAAPMLSLSRALGNTQAQPAVPSTQPAAVRPSQSPRKPKEAVDVVDLTLDDDEEEEEEEEARPVDPKRATTPLPHKAAPTVLKTTGRSHPAPLSPAAAPAPVPPAARVTKPPGSATAGQAAALPGRAAQEEVDEEEDEGMTLAQRMEQRRADSMTLLQRLQAIKQGKTAPAAAPKPAVGPGNRAAFARVPLAGAASEAAIAAAAAAAVQRQFGIHPDNPELKLQGAPGGSSTAGRAAPAPARAAIQPPSGTAALHQQPWQGRHPTMHQQAGAMPGHHQQPVPAPPPQGRPQAAPAPPPPPPPPKVQLVEDTDLFEEEEAFAEMEAARKQQAHPAQRTTLVRMGPGPVAARPEPRGPVVMLAGGLRGPAAQALQRRREWCTTAVQV